MPIGGRRFAIPVIGRVRRRDALPGQLRETSCRGEIINARLWILEVERLAEIALGQQPPTESSHVGELERELFRQLASDGKIQGVGVRSLDAGVRTPSDGLTCRVRSLWKFAIGRRLEELNSTAVQGRNLVDIRDARYVGRIIHTRNTAGILYCSGESSRSVCVESAD